MKPQDFKAPASRGARRSEGAPLAQPRGRKDYSTKPFAVFCRRPDGRECLFGRYETQREGEAVAKQLFDVGCVVSIDAGANAHPHWFAQEARVRNAINRALRARKPRSGITASELAAELRAKYPGIADGWFHFDTAVAIHLRRRSAP